MTERMYWTWESDPNVRNKRCKNCNESMRLDHTSAVRYQEDVYHLHCLLTKLSKYHYENCGFKSEENKLVDSSVYLGLPYP